MSITSTDSSSLFQPGSENRVLAACVLASLLAHAALLWIFPGMRERAPAAVSVLRATLLRPDSVTEPRVSEALPRAPERPRRVVKESPPPEPPRTAVMSRDTDSPALPDQPLPAPAPSVPVAPVSLQAENIVPAAPAVAPPRVPQVQAALAPRLSPAAPPANFPDAGNLDQYRLALMGVARRYKRYPAQAVENGWTGKVEVRLVIGADGGVERALVKSSSGHDILDSQALDMVRRAESLTPVPPALRGREFSVDIPVVFDLQTG